jgi:hypothetical protein
MLWYNNYLMAVTKRCGVELIRLQQVLCSILTEDGGLMITPASSSEGPVFNLQPKVVV